MPNNNLLELDNIRCTRGSNTLFSNLNLEVGCGELLRIRGENGSGKTSLLRIISGISPPDEGQLYWNKTRIQKSDTFTQSIAYLAHRNGLKAELTAIENLQFYQNLYQQQATSLSEVLETLDLGHVTYVQTGQLSFGQRRRLAFARLLLSSAQLWLLDEPFTGIDVAGREILEEQCIQFLNNSGIIIMTHHAEIENKTLARMERSVELT